MAGYYTVVKHFGRSILIRTGRSYMLVWQKRKVTYSPTLGITLTREQYKHISSLLGEPLRSEEWPQENDGVKSADFYYEYPRKIYMRIKRYLIKENII